jgi:ubiquinol-cytochrome c reductase iron-sulfur subunit
MSDSFEDPGNRPGNDPSPDATEPGREQPRTGFWSAALLLLSFKVLSKLSRIFLSSQSPAKPDRIEGVLQSDRQLPGAATGKSPCAECESAKSRRGEKPSRVLEAHTPVAAVGASLVTLFVLVAFAGGVMFLFVYWTGGNNQLLGGSLAVFFGGLGIALVTWSRLMVAYREIAEPRESSASAPAERAGAASDFLTGAEDIQRRGFLKWTVGLGLGVLAGMVLSLIRSWGPDPRKALYSRVWERGQRLMTSEGKPVSVDMLERGSTVIVFPENSVGTEKAQTVLVRVDERLLQLPSDRSDWAPKGNVAFSRVCTHAGCAVGMYETTTHQLMCPCHQSTFDVLRAASPTGGPAERALPQLPLYVDENGILRAAGGFSEPPGPGFWGMP